jgi:uncharacterized protein
MQMNRMICIIFILIYSLLPGKAQEANIMNQFSKQFEPETHVEDYHIHADHSNELKTVSSLLFLFYKEFISSQDINACVFSPSCSVYAIESIKKKGILLGTIATMDRITRCNGLAYGYYPTDPDTNLNHDPVN